MISVTGQDLLQTHTGRVFVEIDGFRGVVEVFGKDWTLLEFILFALKDLSGVDERCTKEEMVEVSKKWRITGLKLFENGGNITAERIKEDADLRRDCVQSVFCVNR